VGKHNLTVSKAGYESYNTTVTVTEGHSVAVNCLLTAKSEQKSVSQDPPLITVEQMPTFQGGDLLSFRRWVMSQIRYPEIAQQNGIQGRVLVKFIVEIDGSLSNIKVIQSPDTSLTAEAVRVISNSPKWEPGRQRNDPVRVLFTMPVNFRLQ